MKAICVITIDGVDVSSAFDPLILSLNVSDRAGEHSASCRIELADPEGSILMPATGALMTVALGFETTGAAIVFTGKVDEPRSRGSRDAGRTIEVSAKEIDAAGKVKQTQQKHFDQKSVKDVLTEAGQEAGVTEIVVDEALGAVVLPYAAMVDESFLTFGRRLAAEMGATFKVSDARATFTARNGGGMPFPTMTAEWGRNLLDWDIAPTQSRPRFGRTRARAWDAKTATALEETEETGIEGAEAETADHFSAPDKAAAARRAGAAKATSERDSGGGTVTIIGCVEAQPEGKLLLVGARPGVDGTYVIDGVDHDYSRDGFTTSLTLKKPTTADDQRGG